MNRSCLHCVFAHALRVYEPRLRALGLAVRVGRFEPLWLPLAGAAMYRALARLLAETCAVAAPGPVKLAVLDLLGKPDVEVTATAAVRMGGGVRVLKIALPRQHTAALEGGFLEGLGDDGW